MRLPLAVLALGVTLVSCSGGGSGTSNSTPTQPGTNTTTPVLTTVTISASAQTATVGGTLQLSAIPKDQNGSALNATVTWTTSAPAVASVSTTGLVTALSAGTATITATATVGSTTVSATTQVTVSPAPPVLVLTSVTASVTPSSITVGTTAQATANPKDQNGAAIAATVTWTSSAPAVATINPSTGLVSAVAAGTATLTASANAGTVTVTATTLVTVTVVPVTAVLSSVSVNPNASTIFVGNSLTLVASPKDQNNAPIAATVTWSSSASGIASVDPGTGAVLGVTAGAATITATATAGGVTKTGIAQITVTAPPVLTSVIVSGASGVPVGSDVQLTATALDQFGSAITAAIAWSSSATGTATVNGSGLVHGVAVGSATISASATSNGVTKTGTLSVSVTQVFPLSVNVDTPGLFFSPGGVAIAVGGTVTWNLNGAHGVHWLGAFPPGGDIAVGAGGSANFPTPGTYNYQCTIHGAAMPGQVVVH